jgi:hypothetical protein
VSIWVGIDKMGIGHRFPDRAVKFQHMGAPTSSRSRNGQEKEAFMVIYRATNIKVLFLPCYKNASSSLFAWLAGLEGNVSLRGGVEKLRISRSRKEAAACLARDEISLSSLNDYIRCHQDHLVFGVIRNPYSRILSAYRDKINRLVKRCIPGIYVKALIQQIMEGPASWSDNKSAIRHMRRMVSFGDFLHKLASVGLEIDGHYLSQAALMRSDLLPDAQFFRLECLCESLVPAMADHLLRQGYAPGSSLEGLPMQNAMGGPGDYRSFYNVDLMSTVEELYATDFQWFGYAKGVL